MPQEQAQQDQAQQRNLADQERESKCKELGKQLKGLENELENTKADLAAARENKEPTGPIYTEKQLLEEKIRSLKKEIEKYCGQKREPGKPDLKEKQTAISTSSVRRKTDTELKRN